jgi:predicted esterase
MATPPLSPGSTPTEPPSPRSFHDHFPNTRFVFPTAPLRRAVVFKRSLTHQWFDNWSHIEPDNKQHLQIPGLRETSAFLHNLLREESEIIGPKNVVLMGLSQGCAASLVATLLWEGEVFGGVVGMCGYLPFRKDMCGVIEEDVRDEENDTLLGDVDDEEDMFERDDQGSGGGSKFEKAVEWLREELQIHERKDENAEAPPMQSIPVFMGHGTQDEKVPFQNGKLAAEFLKGIDVHVEWREYEGLGHCYSDDMLRDVVQFLKTLKGWEESDLIETKVSS